MNPRKGIKKRLIGRFIFLGGESMLGGKPNENPVEPERLWLNERVLHLKKKLAHCLKLPTTSVQPGILRLASMPLGVATANTRPSPPQFSGPHMYHNA